MLSLSAAIGMDFTCAFLFGLSAGTNFITSVSTRDAWLDAYAETKRYFVHVSELHLLAIIPSILLNAIRVPWPLPASVLGTIEAMGEWNLAMCRTAASTLSSNEKPSPDDHPLIYSQMATGLSKINAKEANNELVIASEMLDQILAGHETTAVTLTYLMYELSLQPTLQTKLRSELRSLPSLTDPKALDALPFLDALITETLRRYPAASGSEPRVVPRSGTTISGHFIPAGTRISASQYSLHRSPVFAEPEAWRPERWLDASPEMRRWFWAFGSGARMCLGVHFALQEIKLVVAAIYAEFETEVVEAGSMVPTDGFVGRPRGEKCILRFKQV